MILNTNIKNYYFLNNTNYKKNFKFKKQSKTKTTITPLKSTHYSLVKANSKIIFNNKKTTNQYINIFL